MFMVNMVKMTVFLVVVNNVKTADLVMWGKRVKMKGSTIKVNAVKLTDLWQYSM